MNPSTASGRLVKDLLWNFIKLNGQDTCSKCGEEMGRHDFSIEHITPWLDSEDPFGLFFDLENIAYSHLSCNVGARRRELAKCGTRSAYIRGCRCDLCRNANMIYQRASYSKENRQKRYKLKGC